MGRVTHFTKWFSSQTLLYCRDYYPAYKEFKTVRYVSRKFDKDYQEVISHVTCKKCLKKLKQKAE